jgi:hypothetical protein
MVGNMAVLCWHDLEATELLAYMKTIEKIGNYN